MFSTVKLVNLCRKNFKQIKLLFCVLFFKEKFETYLLQVLQRATAPTTDVVSALVAAFHTAVVPAAEPSAAMAAAVVVAQPVVLAA